MRKFSPIGHLRESKIVSHRLLPRPNTDSHATNRKQPYRMMPHIAGDAARVGSVDAADFELLVRTARLRPKSSIR